MYKESENNTHFKECYVKYSNFVGLCAFFSFLDLVRAGLFTLKHFPKL